MARVQTLGWRMARLISSFQTALFCMTRSSYLAGSTHSLCATPARHRSEMQGDNELLGCQYCEPLGVYGGEKIVTYGSPRERVLHESYKGCLVLPAYARLCRPISFYRRVERIPQYNLYTRCHFCLRFHIHGGDENPLQGTGDGPRGPHCIPGRGHPVHEHDYILKCVGMFEPILRFTHPKGRRCAPAI